MEKLPGIIETLLIALIAWVLSGCTSHTRYYSTDGTSAVEFERTTTIGGGNGTAD